MDDGDGDGTGPGPPENLPAARVRAERPCRVVVWHTVPIAGRAVNDCEIRSIILWKKEEKKKKTNKYNIILPRPTVVRSYYRPATPFTPVRCRVIIRESLGVEKNRSYIE